MDGVDLRILKAFDVGGAGPAHLLQKPAEEGGGGIGGGERAGVEGYFPVAEQEIGCQVAIFVDDCLYAERGLCVPG